ncbi:MAG: glycosyltransferase, partial [Xanthobacteraceae bacterium]
MAWVGVSWDRQRSWRMATAVRRRATSGTNCGISQARCFSSATALTGPMHGFPSAPAAPASATAAPATAEIAVIVPVYKARAQVPLLLDALERALGGTAWEVLFVDDNSPDGTGAAVRAIGATDARVRCLHRIGRRGAAGACLEGMLASQADFLFAIDIERPGDAALIPAMLETMRGGADVVVASRHATGAGRHWSRALARRFTGVELSDPLSATFLIRRDAFEPLAASLSPNRA